MLSRKIYLLVLFFFSLAGTTQNAPIKIPSLVHPIKKIEAMLLQEKSFENDTLALKKYLKPLKSTKELAVLYNALLANGYSNCLNKTNPKSEFHYLQSIKKANELKNKSLEIWTQLNYIMYLYHHKEYVTMTPLLLKMMERLEKVAPEQLILPGESFKKIGWIMQTLADYDNAFHYLNLAKKHTPQKTAEYAAILDAIGLNYFRVGNLKEAESYFQRTALLATQIKDEVRYAKAIGNLALVNQQKGNIKGAIALLSKDIRISEKGKSNQNTMYASILLAEMYLADKDWHKAKETLEKAEKIAYSKSYFKKSELKIIKLKLAILQHQNKTDNELVLLRRMMVLEDSLKNKDGDIAINNSYWLVQKTKFNQKLNKAEDQLKNESERKNIYAILIILILLLVFFFYQNTKKELKTKQLEHQQNILELELDKIKTEQKLSEANESLNAQVDYLKEKNVQIKKLKFEIDQIKQSSSDSSLEKKTGKLNNLLESHLMTESNWNTFRREFQKEHPEYYRLLEDFPEITNSNKRMLLLQKLEFNNQEIADLLGVTPDAIKKSKQRLKKKLGTKFTILFNTEKMIQS
ncbi:tetratricopeptide repeat protein [Flavobacterium acetivorans]|uniref:tetratricopeptide repeat protein n=1 Tax=Flavobacterium acetivorans TaxID=2893883 RepID=UPI001E3C7B63|nr:tetratricopeptide repeat protein [Flavobacterium sp. F-29]UFH34907.1 hypothetical protein LNP19_12510 [Flavobacterium sp. F-29]